MVIIRAGTLCIAYRMKKYHFEFAFVGILLVIRYFTTKSIVIAINLNNDLMLEYTSRQWFFFFDTKAIISCHNHSNTSISRAGLSLQSSIDRMLRSPSSDEFVCLNGENNASLVFEQKIAPSNGCCLCNVAWCKIEQLIIYYFLVFTF